MMSVINGGHRIGILEMFPWRRRGYDIQNMCPYCFLQRAATIIMRVK